MPADRIQIDFDNARAKRMVIDHIKAAKGLCWVEITRCRNQKSKEQLGYYFGVVVMRVKAAIERVWGEKIPAIQVHELCKSRFLMRDIIDHRTGEVVGSVAASVADLDTKEMTDYIENVRMFAAEMFDEQIPDPDKNWEN